MRVNARGPMLWECLWLPYPWPNQWAVSKLQGQAAAGAEEAEEGLTDTDPGSPAPTPTRALTVEARPRWSCR